MVDEDNLEQCLDRAKELYKRELMQNKSLREENSKLRDEHYKDKKLSAMKQKLDKMTDDYWRGFSISEKEEKAIEEWKKTHDETAHGYTTERMRLKAEGCCGGRYTYVFVPTSIGTFGKIVCNCGAEFEFQELG